MLFRVLACAIAVLALEQASAADVYPTRPIRFINPTAPGGSAEPIARVIAQKLSESLGQTVVVDSRGGAGGTVGTAMAANSPPDGYTILLGVVSPMAINVSLYGSKLPYDPLRHFAPVSLITKVPQVLSVHPSIQATSIKQLIDLAKDPRAKLNYGSAGSGTTGHLVAELLKKRAGIQITHVPFKGSGPAVGATLSGQVEIMLSGPPAVLALSHAGRLRDMALVDSLKSPQVSETLLKMGAPPEWSSPEQLRAFLRTEIKKFAEIVELAGARID